MRRRRRGQGPASRSIAGDVGGSVRLTRLRRRGMLTVTMPDVLVHGMTIGPSRTSVNLNAAALRRLERRCGQIAAILERMPP